MSPTVHLALVAWALRVMVALQPPAETPWAVTYGATADALVRAAEAHPLFKGSSSLESTQRTLALELALTSFESRFDPKAKGDGGASLGLFQIQTHTAAVLPGVLLEATTAAPVALDLIARSMRICSARPVEERLAWYAAGGPVCRDSGVAKSRHRWERAVWIIKRWPTLQAP